MERFAPADNFSYSIKELKASKNPAKLIFLRKNPKRKFFEIYKRVRQRVGSD
jgi:hypothetical protein